MISRTKIRNTKDEIRNQSTDYTDFFKKSAIGFTLVELLVVISIIALLMGILLPSIGMAIKIAANTRTSARVAELAGGCNMYFTENGYYPGQGFPDELKGSTGGSHTGSQVLAASLFGYTCSDINTVVPDTIASSKYAPLKRDTTFGGKKDDLQEIAGQDNTIWDRNKTDRAPMAVLYYPARLGESGLGQYKRDDNFDYKNKDEDDDGNPDDILWKSEEVPNGAGTQDAFWKYIKDRRFGQSDTPYHPGAFLIIAAGKDRAYGTKDDICYPAFSGN